MGGHATSPSSASANSAPRYAHNDCCLYGRIRQLAFLRASFSKTRWLFGQGVSGPNSRRNPTVSESLYRIPAIRAVALNAQFGHTLTPPTQVIRWSTVAAVIVIVTLVGAAYGFSYEARTTVPGVLEPVAGSVTVRAPQTGIVERVLASEGTRVSRGDLLLVIDTTIATRRNTPHTKLVAQSYRDEIAELEARALLSRQHTELEAQQLAAELHTIAAKLAALARAQIAATEQQSLRQRHLKSLRPLGQGGLIATRDLAMAEEAVHDIEGRLATMDAERVALLGQHAQAELALARLETGHAIEESKLLASKAELERRLLDIGPQIEVLVRAPVSGVISAPRIVAGENVGTGAPLFDLLGSPELQAVLMAPSHAAGHVKRGQHVQVRYDAFAYEKYGVQQGTVAEVSGTTLPSSSNPAYRIRVRLDRSQDFPDLRPGMTLQADLTRDRRPVYEWLLAPALKLSANMGTQGDG